MIQTRVKHIVAEMLGFPQSEIADDFDFIRDGGADSLDRVELVMALEEEFETEIADEEAEKIATVGEAVAWIRAHETAPSATK